MYGFNHSTLTPLGFVPEAVVWNVESGCFLAPLVISLLAVLTGGEGFTKSLSKANGR
jgi:hypothetical protein